MIPVTSYNEGDERRSGKENPEKKRWRMISLGRVVVSIYPLLLVIVINLPRTLRSYSVKENHISSEVSEILRYTHIRQITIRE